MERAYKIKGVILFLFSAFLLLNCARKGRPSGGPKDITPPVLLKASPNEFSTQIPTDLKEIIFEFDEYVLLKNYIDQIVISPPMYPTPTFTPTGVAAREVKIGLNDTLKSNTTYVINFGESIQDNNENNPLNFFTYVFSTGQYIDSLEVNGRVNTIGKRENVENIIVALYKEQANFNDSIYITEKPYYIAKVDSSGNYKLPYLAENKYRIIAFQDETPDLIWDKRSEKIAFLDSIVQPGISDNLNLTLFTPVQEYTLQGTQQNGYGKIDFYFTGKPKEVNIVSLDQNIEVNRLVHKSHSDTASIYFDPKLIQQEKNKLRLNFSVQNEAKIDTVKNVAYNLETEDDFNVYFKRIEYTPSNHLQLESNQPIDSIFKDKITVLRDSITLDFTIERINENRFQLSYPIQYESKYSAVVLPNAVKSYYGNTNDSIAYSFVTKTERDYGNLELNLINAPSYPYWLKLYDSKDKEVRSKYGAEQSFNFRNLSPGTYYLTLTLDENSDGIINTGDIFKKRQPEQIILYPTAIEVKAFWDLTEQWVLPEDL